MQSVTVLHSSVNESNGFLTVCIKTILTVGNHMCVRACVYTSLRIRKFHIKYTNSPSHAADCTRGLVQQKPQLAPSQGSSPSIDWLSFLSFSECVQSAMERI